MNHPIDIPTRETADFLATHLHEGAEVLEVGSGDGHVAVELARRGCRVIGLDSDPEATARAQQNGIAAFTVTWPDFDHPAVDAIAFTRSLHHIHPLDQAVRRARELLRPGGVLLVEDFAFDEIDDPTIDWFTSVLRREPGRILIRPVPSFVTRLLEVGDARAHWRRHHGDHDVSSAAAIEAAIAARFEFMTVRAVPYLYRYLVPLLAETREAAGFIDELRRTEARLAGEGRAVLIGRRYVAR